MSLGLYLDRELRVAALRRVAPRRPPYVIDPTMQGSAGNIRIDQINKVVQDIVYSGVAETFFTADPLLGYLKRR